MITTTYHAPLGDIQLTADERGLTGLWFAGARPAGLLDAFAQADTVNPFTDGPRDPKSASTEYIAGADAESGSPGMGFEEQCNASAMSVIERTWGWLNSYFAGQMPLWLPPLHLEGDELQHEVWAALLTVPYGETVTCAALAELVSARGVMTDTVSVAVALASSPVSLIIPVHRVVDATATAHQAALRDWER